MQKTYIFISLLVVLAAGVLVWFNTKSTEVSLVACTREAQLCPDGSAVGRTGPNCEFAECPKVSPPPPPVTGEVALSVGEKGKMGDLSIIVNKFISDSRCPADVQCIWAGEFKVEITISSNLSELAKNETHIISSIDKPLSFKGRLISISSVSPYPASKKIDPSDYRITFHVEANEKTSVVSTGTINGRVTLSPICPVERMPPDPKCAPKPSQTKIEVFSAVSGKLITTTQTGTDGRFEVSLPFDFYKIEAGTGTMLPRCSPVSLHLQTSVTSVDISCDTGIR
ncbi:MAG: hypothetical protein Q7K40_00830 [bacterium]|nr:hypothetical protein [bacterium]